jgi:hypothetical protein
MGVGSNPTVSHLLTIFLVSSAAERLIVTQDVGGSNPSLGVFYFNSGHIASVKA